MEKYIGVIDDPRSEEEKSQDWRHEGELLIKKK